MNAWIKVGFSKQAMPAFKAPFFVQLCDLTHLGRGPIAIPPRFIQTFTYLTCISRKCKISCLFSKNEITVPRVGSSSIRKAHS